MNSQIGNLISKAGLGFFGTAIVSLLTNHFIPDPWWISAGVLMICGLITLIMIIPKKAETDEKAKPATSAAKPTKNKPESKISSWPLALVMLLIASVVILIWKGGAIWDYCFGEEANSKSVSTSTIKYYFRGHLKPGEIKMIRPKDKPLEVVFDEFTEPIWIKWLRKNNGGKWVKVPPKKANRFKFYALADRSTPKRQIKHQTGLPLLIRSKKPTFLAVKPF